MNAISLFASRRASELPRWRRPGAISAARRATALFASLLLAGAVAAPAAAQFGELAPDNSGATLGDESVTGYEVGVLVTAEKGPCRNIVAYLPAPANWPEQQVEVVSEDVSSQVKKVEYRDIGNGEVRQMVVTIPSLKAGEEARAVATFRVARRQVLPPESTSSFVLPKKFKDNTRRYLTPSPKIESNHRKIRDLAREVVQGKEGAWEQVEAIYDWVRENVEYKNGPLKGAMAALDDKTGDCEELTSLFIALCRANGIPARTVWVPSHCYPEFMLEDEEGNPHWFPCQAAGTRSFGGIPETRPVLQKGDNFRVPGNRERQRYMSERLDGTPAPGGGPPKVQFVRKPVAAPN